MKYPTALWKPLLLALVLFMQSVPAYADQEIVTLDDGTTVKVFMFYPKSNGEGPWPLCVLMPGGVANEYIARAQFWLGHELATRGWAIAVPVSPDAKAFFGSNAAKIPKVIAHLQKSPSIITGKTLLVGVSNGGSSAIEIASLNPENYLGVVAVPGILKDESVLGDLQQLPIFLRIGANDFLRWNRKLPDIVDSLTKAGAQVDAALMPGANHVFPINWGELQPWLDSLPPQ